MTASATLPKPAGAACEACPGRNRPCVRPERARGAARLALVGESPGRNEVEEGRPFVGASGKVMQRGLHSIGLARADVHWTNAILCDVPVKDQAAARRCCAARLAAELADTGATHVLALGGLALQSAIASGRKTPIQRWRGSVVRHTLDAALVQSAEPTHCKRGDGGSNPSGGSAQLLIFPTLHPAFTMRAPLWRPVLERDVARLGRLLDTAPDAWRAPEEMPHRRLVVPRTLDELQHALGSLATDDISNDVETVGLGPTHTLLVCNGISDGVTTIVVPWSRGRDGRESWWGTGERHAVSLINAAFAARRVVTHNGPAFDHIVNARYGIRVTRWEDTLLGRHSFASHLPRNLAMTVTTYLDVSPWKELENRTADLERLWGYCGQDNLYTILAWRAMNAEMRIAA